MDEHVEIYAVITDRWGGVEEAYAGSMPVWAWEEGPVEWKKMNRKSILGDRTSDARGWRVVFEARA